MSTTVVDKGEVKRGRKAGSKNQFRHMAVEGPGGKMVKIKIPIQSKGTPVVVAAPKRNYTPRKPKAPTSYTKVIVQRPFTMAQVIKDGQVISMAFAKCNSHDKWDEELGKSIAIGRAQKRLERGTTHPYTEYTV